MVYVVAVAAVTVSNTSPPGPPASPGSATFADHPWTDDNVAFAGKELVAINAVAYAGDGVGTGSGDPVGVGVGQSPFGRLWTLCVCERRLTDDVLPAIDVTAIGQSTV